MPDNIPDHKWRPPVGKLAQPADRALADEAHLRSLNLTFSDVWIEDHGVNVWGEWVTKFIRRGK